MTYRDPTLARAELEPQRLHRVGAFFCRLLGHRWLELARWRFDRVEAPQRCRGCVRCGLREYNGVSAEEFEYSLYRVVMIRGSAAPDISRLTHAKPHVDSQADEWERNNRGTRW